MTYNKALGLNKKPSIASNKVPNNGGGEAFKIDDWKYLERFLILGSEGGTYYVSEQKLTVDAAKVVWRCLNEDPERTVRTIVEISDSGRAPKNEPAILALAIAFSHPGAYSRIYAEKALPKVCRIGTHLFHFAAYIDSMRGWGRGLRRAVANWYDQKSIRDVAYQVVKYQSRDGWSHRDLLRLSHPIPTSTERQAVYHWITKGGIDGISEDAKVILGFEFAKRREYAHEVAQLATEYQLPREAIPTQFLNSVEVQKALLPNMGLTAIIRNLGNMSKSGLLGMGSEESRFVVNTIEDEKKIEKARIHPIAILAASITYGAGHGNYGHGEWEVNPRIIDALEQAYFSSFKYVQPTGKRILMGLDVSGSMGAGEIAGIPGFTPAQGTACMSMVTARVEKDYNIVGFSKQVVQLRIGRGDSLQQAMAKVQMSNFGSTNCAAAIEFALRTGGLYDAFIIYTDNETNSGTAPEVALANYRKKTGINAKLIVVGMTSTGFSIGDPKDLGTLNIVGFDTNTPALISEFLK
jgi:60 kDa SS-A/Ro ribonucleoprotein